MGGELLADSAESVDASGDTSPDGDRGDAHALGMMGECVMSVYGIARSLTSRDLGPAQLLPAIDDFRIHSAKSCASVYTMLDGLEARAQSTPLATTAVALTTAVRDVTRNVGDLFSEAGKLGARERLAMERHIDRVGGDLQAAHRLIGVLEAALAPRPIMLSLSDLLRGRWAPNATFSQRRVELCVRAHGGERFFEDPKVAWAFVEHVLFGALASSQQAFAEVRHRKAGDDVRAILHVGDKLPADSISVLRCAIDIGPRLAVEDAIFKEIGQHLGWLRPGESDAVQISMHAA